MAANNHQPPPSFYNMLTSCSLQYQDTPDYTVGYLRVVTPLKGTDLDTQDSDTNPNTTASSVAGDFAHGDGRKRRSEAHQLRKSVLGKKHGSLNESKVCHPQFAIVLMFKSQCLEG